ncbi:hypothetical protein HOLleu_31526 [Holothuria leucospilota]|uniref:G-protein coupled receptors family 1 profile domain-containing protein n=1 Tax=Holothuria leucospilota TaxID=206669 RepID=A0A9Q0YQ76_HOLLE|nr:hypothetical protein HOLleu_31526 [Holothuria leucospilota]
MLTIDCLFILNSWCDGYIICCFLNESTECITTSSLFATCSAIFDNWPLKLSAWAVSAAAVGANLLVLFRRIKHGGTNIRTITVKVAENVFLANLAIADLFMGVYLMSVAIADITFGNNYYFISQIWKTGPVCGTLGVIGVLSTLVSLSVLTLMTIDRFLCIVFPYSSIRFNRTGAITTCAVVWVTSFFLACLSLVGTTPWVKTFYEYSDVCLGLPIVAIDPYFQSNGQHDPTGKTDTWFYSTVIYTLFSSLCLLVVIVCYISMFVSVKRSRGGSSRHSGASNEDIKLAKRISVIVGTDMLCWLPVIILSVLTQNGVAVPTQLNCWLVVLVIPINSALNPFIYSYGILRGKKKNETTETRGMSAIELRESRRRKNDLGRD